MGRRVHYEHPFWSSGGRLTQNPPSQLTNGGKKPGGKDREVRNFFRLVRSRQSAVFKVGQHWDELGDRSADNSTRAAELLSSVLEKLQPAEKKLRPGKSVSTP